MKKKITIITPTFNSAKTILANISSVKKQKYKNLEHIIIDNNSDDQTVNLIKKSSHKNIKIITEKDNGIYDAINKGIGLSNGKYINTINAGDTYFSENSLKIIKDYFEKKKKYSFCFWCCTKK